jgi:hypothetical protein
MSGIVNVQCTHCSFTAVGANMAQALERYETHYSNKHSQRPGGDCGDFRINVCGTDAEKEAAMNEAERLGYKQADGPCQN